MLEQTDLTGLGLGLEQSSPSQMKLFAITEFSDVFVDAVVQDFDAQILFLSIYGRDAAVRQFLAQIQLGENCGGVDRFTVNALDGKYRQPQIEVGDARELSQKSAGKLPAGMFGAVTHSFLQHRKLQELDRANGSAYVLLPMAFATLTPQHLDDARAAAWRLICELSEVPLLPHWQSILFDRHSTLFQSLDKMLYRPLGCVSGWRVQLPPDWSRIISEYVRTRTLVLDANAVPEQELVH